MPKTVSPSVSKTSFNCPHCGTLTTQYWYDLYGAELSKEKVPNIWSQADADDFKFLPAETEEQKAAEKNFRRWLAKKASAQPFVERSNDPLYLHNQLENVYASRCYECSKVTLWIADRPIWPPTQIDIEPNSDLPDDVRADFVEASQVFNVSPRAAAALLRLAVQRLCAHLGGKGKNIDADIGALVAAGLDVKIQRALDVVRVIGNNAVHPGQINVNDNVEIAQSLFGLVNLIADRMISQPKHIDALYGGLPSGALEAIEKRDTPKAIAAPPKTNPDD